MSEWNDHGVPARCRWPEKVKHPSKPEALDAIRSLYKAGKGNPDMNVYPCGDHWHTGHNAAHFRKRIRAALRSTPTRRRR